MVFSCQIDVVLGHLSGSVRSAITKLRELHVVLTNDHQAAAVTSGMLQQPHALKGQCHLNLTCTRVIFKAVSLCASKCCSLHVLFFVYISVIITDTIIY